MALTISKTTYSPVEFDGLGSFAPTMTVERRLRVQRLKFDTSEDAEEALEYMASCFEPHSEEVKKFLTGANVLSWYNLQAYLMGGDKMIEQILSINEATEQDKNG